MLAVIADIVDLREDRLEQIPLVMDLVYIIHFPAECAHSPPRLARHYHFLVHFYVHTNHVLLVERGLQQVQLHFVEWKAVKDCSLDLWLLFHVLLHY